MANVTYTVPNKNGSYDGDMVLKQYTSMTINSGDTVTVDQPCRGLFIYVQGNCTINGTLSMSQRGAFANPNNSGGSDNNAVNSNGLRLPMLTSGGSDTLAVANTLFNGCGNAVRSAIANQSSISGNGTILTIAKTNTSRDSFSGQTRNSQSSYGTPSQKSSVTNSTGTGGRGGYWMNDSGCNGYVYVSGGYSSCFGGGSGGGGSPSTISGSDVTRAGGGGGGGVGNPVNNRPGGSGGGGFSGNGGSCGATGDTTQAVDYGGAGGNGSSNHSYAGVGGGAGNPKGAGYGGNVSGGGNGNGGVIWLIVGGNLTIGGSGVISANGNTGNNTWGDFNSAGGGSGGGRIIIAHKGTYSNSGTVQANGGNGGTTGNSWSEAGQKGMNGTVTVQQVL